MTQLTPEQRDHYLRSALMQGFAPLTEEERNAFQGTSDNAVACMLETDDQRGVIVLFDAGRFAFIVGETEHAMALRSEDW